MLLVHRTHFDRLFSRDFGECSTKNQQVVTVAKGLGEWPIQDSEKKLRMAQCWPGGFFPTGYNDRPLLTQHTCLPVHTRLASNSLQTFVIVLHELSP